MTAAVGTNTVAGLQTQVATLTNQLTAGGVNVGAILGGGAAALTGQPAAGATGAAGLPAAPLSSLEGRTGNGATVQVTRDNAKGTYVLTRGTGRDEIVTILENGAPKQIRFLGSGKQATNFDVMKREPIKVNIDDREGVAAGISNLSRVVASRQERVKRLTEAAAADSNENGTLNQMDMQLIVQEQATNDHMNGLNKKIFDGVEESISLWLR